MHNSRIVQNYDATNTALKELTQAARAENIELIVHLLDQGISLIRSDKTSNLSPLATLASEGRNEMVMRLLSMEIMPSEGKIVTRYINEVYKGAIIGKNSDLLHQVQSKYPRIPGKTRYKAALKLIQLLSGCSEAEAAITDYVDTLSWVIDLCASAGQFDAAFKTMREYLFIGCVVGDADLAVAVEDVELSLAGGADLAIEFHVAALDRDRRQLYVASCRIVVGGDVVVRPRGRELVQPIGRHRQAVGLERGRR